MENHLIINKHKKLKIHLRVFEAQRRKILFFKNFWKLEQQHKAKKTGLLISIKKKLLNK